MSRPIYQIIEEILKTRKLKVADIARQCGLPDSTVRGIIVRKQKSVALEVAFKLSKGLGVSLEYLNGENEKKSSDGEQPTEEQITTEFLINLGVIKKGQDLTDEQLRILGALIPFIRQLFI